MFKGITMMFNPIRVIMYPYSPRSKYKEQGGKGDDYCVVLHGIILI